MAKSYRKITTIKMFPNTEGRSPALYGNGNWKPWVDGANADINLRSDAQYSCQLFKNDDGTMTCRISEVVPYEATDDISSGVSQSGLKPVAQAIGGSYPINNEPAPAPKKDEFDDDIPF
jgi:hypothetical protein